MSKWYKPDSVLWHLGFRSFFLAAAAYAAITLLLWLGVLHGIIPSFGYFSPSVWHAHEMIYGFCGAVIAGFVLTAAQNWTGQRAVHGRQLQTLWIIWFLGRLGILIFPRPNIFATGLDLAFFPLVGVYLLPHLRDSEMKPERVFLLYFILFFSANLVLHLEAFGLLQGYSSQVLRLAVHTVVAMICFMGGRVIPFFTESSIAKVQPKTWPAVELLSHITLWLFILTQLIINDSLVAAGVAVLTCLAHLIRLIGWQVRRIRRIPLVWVLHLGYLWICIGFLATGLSTPVETIRANLPVFFPPTLAIHAFTVGGLGLLIFGMMSRVSLGHTGRRLHPTALTVIGFHLINLAACLRFLGPLLAPQQMSLLYQISGLFWVTAFGLFLVVYRRILTGPRADQLIQIQPQFTQD
jgi:uncharacterized protein involved in response to NO